MGKVSAGEPVLKLCRRSARDWSQRSIWTWCEKPFSNGSSASRGLGQLSVTPELGATSPTAKPWKQTGGSGFSSRSAPATPPYQGFDIVIEFPSFLILSSKKKKNSPCMEEPPPFDGRVSYGPAGQLCAPDVLVESKHSSGHLLSPCLLPVRKTEGAACSDSGFPSIKPGQNPVGDTQGLTEKGKGSR